MRLSVMLLSFRKVGRTIGLRYRGTNGTAFHLYGTMFRLARGICEEAAGSSGGGRETRQTRRCAAQYRRAAKGSIGGVREIGRRCAGARHRGEGGCRRRYG